MTDLFEFTSSALPDDIKLLDFRFVEGISTPYELFVDFQTRSPDDVDLTDAIGAKAKLKGDRGSGGAAMTWAGMFAAIEHMHQIEGVAVFRGLVVPPMWFLAHGEHSRVFTQKNIKDIITEVLQDAGLLDSDFEFRLDASPATEELVCQYRESDLSFIQRWLEREGMYYYFEHGDDGAKMIITDRKASESLRTDAIRYFPTHGHDATSGEAFQRFRATRRAALANIKLRDYDYAKPALDVKGEASASSTGSTEFSRFGDRFFTPSDGNRLAKIRADGALAREEMYVGSGTALGLRTGYVFELEQHPRSALNKKYFAVRLEHRGVQSSALSKELAAVLGVDHQDVYRVDVHEATDAELAYRHPRSTPWPRVSGQEVATVDGPSDGDHYAQLDDDGRYLVKFAFDENSHDDGKASTRVRMMQPHAGNPEGFHFPLRKGTEVVIIFLGGDPDRPIIAGAVPNALTPSPVTASNHTRNKIITGSQNVIELEDLKGKEWIDVYTPALHTDLHMGTAKDWKDVGKSPRTVQANYGEHTDGDAARTVGGNQFIDIGKKLEEHVCSDVQEDYDAKVDQTYTGPKTQTVSNLVTEKFNSGQETTVNDHRKITVTGTRTDHVTGKVTENFDTMLDLTIGGGGYKQTVSGARSCHWNGNAFHYGPEMTETFIKITWDTTTTKITGSAMIELNTPFADFTLDSYFLNCTSCSWKTGPVTWFTPSTQIFCPDWNVIGKWYQTGTLTGSFYIMTLQAYALNYSASGICAQLNGINFGAGGVNLGLYLLDLGTHALKSFA
jgi:type VI secretion system secreted protein VgrG